MELATLEHHKNLLTSIAKTGKFFGGLTILMAFVGTVLITKMCIGNFKQSPAVSTSEDMFYFFIAISVFFVFLGITTGTSFCGFFVEVTNIIDRKKSGREQKKKESVGPLSLNNRDYLIKIAKADKFFYGLAILLAIGTVAIVADTFISIIRRTPFTPDGMYNLFFSICGLTVFLGFATGTSFFRFFAEITGVIDSGKSNQENKEEKAKPIALIRHKNLLMNIAKTKKVFYGLTVLMAIGAGVCIARVSICSLKQIPVLAHDTYSLFFSVFGFFVFLGAAVVTYFCRFFVEIIDVIDSKYGDE